MPGFPFPDCVDPSQVPSNAEFCPWGWTPSTVEFGQRHEWVVRAPRTEVVAAVNNRRFSVELEREFGCELQNTAIIESVSELQAAFDLLSTDRWVIKAEYGMSARERILGRGRQLSDAQQNWVARRLQGGNAVILEPWVDIIEEAGLQFTLPEDRDRPVRLEGITPLITDDSGTYRGSRFDANESGDAAWRAAVDTATRAAERIRDRGYFGPLGIDAARYL